MDAARAESLHTGDNPARWRGHLNQLLPNDFRTAWRTACQAAGVNGVTFRDRRGTFITRLSDGCLPIEVAMCTGLALRDLVSLDTYTDRSALARALATRRGPQEHCLGDLQVAALRTLLHRTPRGDLR